MNKRHYEHTLPNIRGSLSNTYALCAVAMFVGAVITPSPIKVVSVTLLALICLFSLFLVKLAYCEMKSKNDIL